MPFKKLPRRAFLTTNSALAFLHTPFARALSARQSVNIDDYNPRGWAASPKQAFSEGQTAIVPGELACDSISTGIFISPGKALCILGSLRGSGRGWLVLQDGSQVTGREGGSMHNIALDVHGSDCAIKELAVSGLGPVAQTCIGGKNKRVVRNLTIDNPIVSHANYAILRQGFHNQIISVNITNCKFSDSQGDAIEWNVTISDRDILVSDHVIERVNYTNDKINWGIGVGLTRSIYDNNCPEDRAMKNFVVANITGLNCRQLVHVENGKHSVTRNIEAHNITPNFSKKASIGNATVAIYGCDNFVIGNIGMISSAGMLIGYGVIRGRYLSTPQNFRVNNIRLGNTHLAYKLRDIQISAGNVVSFVALTSIEMKRASLELHNRPQRLFMRNISVMQKSSVGPALSMSFNMRKDVHGVFMAKKETLLSLTNAHAVNERGQSFVDIDKIGHHIADAEKINSRLPERREQIYDRSWKGGAIFRNNATAIYSEAT